MLLTPASRLGTYEIVAPLGAGGMGEVYRAKDLRLGREIALKVLPVEMANDTEGLARFEGGGGYVVVEAAVASHGSEVSVLSQEWEPQAKQFLEKI